MCVTVAVLFRAILLVATCVVKHEALRAPLPEQKSHIVVSAWSRYGACVVIRCGNFVDN